LDIGKDASYFSMNLNHSGSETERNSKKRKWWQDKAHLQNQTYQGEQERKQN